MKVLAFAASSSKHSINKQLVSYAISLLDEHDCELIDLNDFEMPLYSIDRQNELGIPQEAHRFLEKIQRADAVVISFAEHNGSYSAAYKNLFDWTSRIDPKVYAGKKMLLLAASPGKRGGSSVLEAAVNSMPRFGGEVVAQLSIPSFKENFDVTTGRLSDASLDGELQSALAVLKM